MGVGGMATGELLVEMVARIPLEPVEADVLHLMELLYRPAHPKRGRAGMYTPARPQTHRSLLRFREARQQVLDAHMSHYCLYSY